MTFVTPVRRYDFMKHSILIPAAFVALIAGSTGVLAAENSLPEVKDLPYTDKANTVIGASKQLTFAGSRSGEGYFSADGKKMIYQSEREEGNPFYQIFVLDLISGKSTRISTGKGMTTCGWIHPILKKAMWSSTHLDKNLTNKVKDEYAERAKPVKKRYSWNYDDQYDIFESDLKGGNIKRLTKELGYDAEGSYSPDGKWIAFASNRSLHTDKMTDEEKKIAMQDPSYMMEIYIMKSDGTAVKRLTQTRGYDGGPFFSADGKKITWRRFTPDGHRAEIYTMNIDGTDQKAVTKLNSLSWAPYFHPSGEYIIFASSVLGYANFELFIVDADGVGKPVRVSFTDGFDGLPAFSPDGKKLTWTHRNEKGESQIYLADWDHEQARKLVLAAIPPNRIGLSLTPEIVESDTVQIVNYLASEEFKGRMAGSPEEQVYTEQITHFFRKWGLTPAIGNSFVQNFEFTAAVSAGPNNTLEFKGRVEEKLKRGQDYQVLSYSGTGQFTATPVVFAGYGLSAPATENLPEVNSYKNLDVKDKWVIILDHQPRYADKEMNQHLLFYSRPQRKVAAAKNYKAAGIIIVTGKKMDDINFEGSRTSTSEPPVLRISPEAFGRLLAKTESPYKNYGDLEAAYSSLKAQDGFVLPSQYISANVDLNFHKATGRNVIGKLMPSAKISKKTKAVLIGAHGDHLGKGMSEATSLARADEVTDIHFGADDNASGVAGVLELAHFFSTDKNRTRLRKPLYFAVWSAEELGVLGSSAFTNQWKDETGQAFNQDFEASLNMDMIGRLRDKLEIKGVGSAREWTGLSEEVALLSGLPVSLTSDPYLATDSRSFYLAQIPSISFSTGTHEEYHTPRDTAAKINHQGIVKAVNAVRTFTEKLATVSSQMVKYAHVSGNSGAGDSSTRNFRIYLGTIPDYAQEGIVGVKISGASKNSPAEKAGLKTGDVIVEFDNINIENLYDYVYALQSAKPQQTVKMGVIRDGQRVTLNITPVLKE